MLRSLRESWLKEVYYSNLHRLDRTHTLYNYMDMPLYKAYLGEIMETGIYRVAGSVQWNLTHATT